MEPKPDPQLKRAKIHHVAKQVISDFKSQMYPYTENWIQKQLTPENITQIRDLYITLLSQVRDWGLDNFETNLWIEVELMLDEEMKELSIAYLMKIEMLLENFRSGIQKKIDFFLCFSDKELEGHAEVEYNKLVPYLLQEKLDLQKLVELGCKKLMECYWAQNSQINEAEGDRAMKALPEMVKSYNKQMKALLSSEVVTTQDRLQELHTVLTEKLVDSFRMTFRIPGGGDRISPNVENKVENLRSLLETEFRKHLHKVEGKRRPDILLQTVKTEYDEKVADLLRQHPGGLKSNELSSHHEQIANEAGKLLEMEIRQLSRDKREMARETFHSFIRERYQYLCDENNGKLKEYRLQQQERKMGPRNERESGGSRKIRESERRQQKQQQQQPQQSEQNSIGGKTDRKKYRDDDFCVQS